MTTPCPHWCVSDHSDDEFDPNHWSEYYDPPIALSDPAPDGVGGHQSDHFIAYAVQQEGDPEPEIHVGTARSNRPIVLRPDEAEALAWWLLETVTALKSNKETPA